MVRSLQVPTYLRLAAERRGEEGAAWLERLPEIVEQVAQKWSLVVNEPYEPGGGTSWTAPADRTADGERLVLKIGWRDPECLDEADGLRVWQGEGTVRLFDAWRDGHVNALLLERCEPGIELRHAVPEHEQDLVLAGLMQRLWIEPPAGHNLRPLEEMCALWALECEQRLAESPPPDPGLVREGLAVWRELAESPPRRVLLLTDLHGGNVLSATREPWLVIDPKPYVGDPTYDPMQHMTNCPARLAVDPERFCERMATLTGVDPGRLRLWIFARLVVDAGWPFGDERSPTNYDVARLIAR